jgi:hypothetical protein
MASRKVDSSDDRPLDLVSYARHGPGRREQLSPAEIAQISRTVRRAPEVVVKVSGKASNTLSSVHQRIGYLGRRGELELETDDGDRLRGQGVGRELLEKWDLDLDDHRRQLRLSATVGRKAKLVRNLLFSMPPGTAANAVLCAARNFLKEEFGLGHRYAFVLHTDRPHPHVHALVKAVSEQGVRLDISSATLQRWRQEFARQLRAQGIEANATPRAVRGESGTRKLDGIYRAARRGASTHLRDRVEAVARELRCGKIEVEPGKATLVRTRAQVVRGWTAARDLLVNAGQVELAAQVDRFVQQMPPPRTEKESLATALLQHVKRPLDRSPPTKILAPVR